MDPLLEQTRDHARPTPRDRRKQERRILRQTQFGRWAWTELPAYRASLLVGYAGAIFFGVSSFIAGVPAFTLAAPEGYTPIWSAIMILSGPVGVLGIYKNTPWFHKIEIWAAAALSTTLFTYGATLLAIAYGQGDVNRAAVGSGITVLSAYSIIRLIWLIAQILDERKKSRGK